MSYQHPNPEHEKLIHKKLLFRKKIKDFFETIFATLLIMFSVIGVVATIGFFMNKVQIYKHAGAVHPIVQKSYISWEQDDSKNEEMFKKYKEETGTKINGLAQELLAEGGNSTVCHIYAKLPRNEYDTERLAILGHEVVHCFAGQFHKQ